MVSESIVRKVERFEEGIELLREIAGVSFKEYSKDMKLQSIAERNIQVCVETIIDISNMIISKERMKVPSTYRETIRILREAGILKGNIGRKMEELVGIRNIIVHMYADIKDKIIHENLKEFVKTLKEVLRILLKFCKRKGIDP